MKKMKINGGISLRTKTECVSIKATEIKNLKKFALENKKEKGKILTAGGRVLCPTAKGKNIKEAIERVYQAVEKISWEGEYHRTDIGKKALRKLC